jgi:hypothetical protein
MTCGLECLDFRLLCRVIEGILHVIHRHATACRSCEPAVGELGNAFVGAVPSFEVQDCSPVVREVLKL